MKVVVTGANGFLGSWLLKKLHRENVETYALVRKGSDLSELGNYEGAFVQGDVTQRDTLEEAFHNAHTVFHLAGVVAYKPKDRPLMERVNVEGTRNVIDACLKKKVSKLVHVSSVVAIGAGFSSDQILNEDSVFNVGHLHLGYFDTKKKAEDLVWTAAEQNQLNMVILNPSTIYGPGDARKGSRKTQIKVAQGKFKIYPPGGVNVVAVEDVVEGIVRAWQSQIRSRRFILASENLLIKDVFGVIARRAGVPEPRYPLPRWFLRGAGRAGDLLNNLGIESSLSSETAWTSTLYHWFDSARARRELGLDFQKSEKSIQASVDWMSAQGLLGIFPNE
jgi:dihydroflavonol-4-reductase